MNKYIKGFFKYNIKSNVSIFTFIDCESIVSNKAKIARGCKLTNIDIGDYSYISKNCDISNCKIGKFCSIAPGVRIGFGMHPTNYVSTSPIFYSNKNVFGYKLNSNSKFVEYKKTVIGNDVWVGLNSIILDGVTIGDGAIIGAGSVVTKDVKPYTIVGGIPAKIIKDRFEDDLKNQLLESEWWNKDLSELIKLNEKLNDISYFLENNKKFE